MNNYRSNFTGKQIDEAIKNIFSQYKIFKNSQYVYDVNNINFITKEELPFNFDDYNFDGINYYHKENSNIFIQVYPVENLLVISENKFITYNVYQKYEEHTSVGDSYTVLIDETPITENCLLFNGSNKLSHYDIISHQLNQLLPVGSEYVTTTILHNNLNSLKTEITNKLTNINYLLCTIDTININAVCGWVYEDDAFASLGDALYELSAFLPAGFCFYLGLKFKLRVEDEGWVTYKYIDDNFYIFEQDNDLVDDILDKFELVDEETIFATAD